MYGYWCTLNKKVHRFKVFFSYSAASDDEDEDSEGGGGGGKGWSVDDSWNVKNSKRVIFVVIPVVFFPQKCWCCVSLFLEWLAKNVETLMIGVQSTYREV